MTKSKSENTGGKGSGAVGALSKEAARQCLVLADKFIREENYERARQEVERAQKFDPTNVYIYAFRDRIAHFEDIKKKSAPTPTGEVISQPTASVPDGSEAAEGKDAIPRGEIESPDVEGDDREEEMSGGDVAPAEEVRERKHKKHDDGLRRPTPSRQGPARPKEEGGTTLSRLSSDRHVPRRYTKPTSNLRILPLISVDPTPIATKPPLAILSKGESVNGVHRIESRSFDDATPEILSDHKGPGGGSETESAASEKVNQPHPPPKQVTEVDTASQTTEQTTPGAGSSANRVEVDQRLDEMRRQIEMLTQMLDQEKKAREEMGEKNVREAVRKLRKKMEVAWVNGAPKAEDAKELEEYAIAQEIPDEIVASIQREVKLELYSRAVKEVISKRKLLRSSSNTLEWLRKVYHVTLDEYLEYESKFLMDLVADQFKGTILFISADKKNINEIMPRLKASGFAVVLASSPESALEKIDRVPPHFILCDVEFPSAQLSGTKFLHVIRANAKYNYLPFILLCEQSDFAHMSSYELRPTEAVVKKPVDLDELTSVMNEKVAAFRQYISTLT